MPIYAFECKKCGRKFEEMMMFAAYEKKQQKGFRCPKCKSKRVEQLVVGLTVQTSKKS